MGNDIQTIRRNIAEATHRAVCDFTQSDGCGRCFHYALTGYTLCSRLLNQQYYLQAGKLYIIADPPNGAVLFDSDARGFHRGEFHCWIVAGNDGRMTEFVDLSSRHYRRLVEQCFQSEDVVEGDGYSITTLAANPVRWTRPDQPPEFIWTNGEFPDLIRAIPTPDATEFFYHAVRTEADEYKPLVRLAWSYYQALAGQERHQPKVGRNESCPCGSGRKYKKCCMKSQHHDCLGGHDEIC